MSRVARRGVLAALAVVITGAAVTLVLRSSGAPAQPAVDAPARSALEQAAAKRFAGSQPRLRLPDGKTLAPFDEEESLRFKVNLYKGVLVREEEQRDPTFRLRAEAELARRRPLNATIEWEDLSGNRTFTILVADSSSCGLGDQAEMQLDGARIAQHGCLDREGMWESDSALSVRLQPIAPTEPAWRDLLNGTLKEMAAEAFEARAAAGEASGQETGMEEGA